MNIIKKALSCVTTMCLSATLFAGFSSLKVSAMTDEIEEMYITNDGIWQSASESGAECYDSEIALFSEFPNSVDNSTSIYFPPIGNQGAIGSCAGWATTYYQFTYEVNKYRGIATNSSNMYSPSWTYNYINGGANRSTYLDDAYDILYNQGAMKLVDYPHNTTESQYSYLWSEDTQKMTDALHYRADRYYINCSSSYDLYNAKNNISSGKIGVIWTNANGWTITQTNNGENIIVRGSSYSNGGHFMAVVGYDDTIRTTYNGVTMTGAFKLANSWGSDWNDGNNGYIWVAYDALNSASHYGTNWQTGLNGSRTQIFGSNNEMNFVNINYYPAYYVGKVQYISNDPWHNRIYGDINTTASTPKFSPKTGTGSVSNLANPEYRVIVFDYFSNPNLNAGDYLHSSFTSKVANSRTNNTYRIYISLMDSLCKKILPNDTIAGSITNGYYSRTLNLNLSKGKIASYGNGNITSSDISLLSSYLLGNASLSTLQSYLADMNDDGSIDTYDLILMRQAITPNSSFSEIMETYIPEFGSTIEEFILNEYGTSALEYAENFAA